MFASIVSVAFMTQNTGTLATVYDPPTLDNMELPSMPKGSGYTLTVPTAEELEAGTDIINIPTYSELTKVLTDHFYKYDDNKPGIEYITTDSRTEIKDTSNLDYTGYYKDCTWFDPDKNKGGGAAFRVTGNAKIHDIIGDFLYNTSGHQYGGGAMSIANGTVNSIIGDFIGNNALVENGGAINFGGNKNTIKLIQGSFINNNAAKSGGAMYIKTINLTTMDANFIGNTAESGGALLFLAGTTTNINGNFINNSASGNSETGNSAKVLGDGGAIYNSAGAKISNINANFAGNTAGHGNSVNGGSGGAIYNEVKNGTKIATITNITGDFVSNSAYTKGGAIYNAGTIETIGATRDSYFKGNYTEDLSASGGAIYNAGTIDTINADFVSNYTNVSEGSTSYGGAIFNTSSGASIGEINGNFNTNYSMSGGAIANANEAVITTINGNFNDNHAKDYGGAIHNRATITTINGLFENNYVDSTSGTGGAIQNATSATIGTIAADFNGNYTTGSGTNNAYGGAINNFGSITTITGNFEENHANVGGAIANTSSGVITNLSGTFTGNYTTNSGMGNGYGGAIYNTQTINSITADFIENYALNRGGAIGNQGGTINGLVGNFIGNHSANEGGAVDNSGTGAIISGITGNYFGNYSTTDKSGGAFNNSGTLKFVSTATRGVNFTGNYTKKGSNPAVSNAIYTNSTNGKVYFDANPLNNIVVNDILLGTKSGTNYSKMYINSDGGTGTVEINNSVTNYNTYLQGGTLKLGSHTYTSTESAVLAGQTGVGSLTNLITSGSSTISTINDAIASASVGALTLNNNTKWTFDVDLSDLTADSLTTTSLTANSNSIIIDAINFLADASTDTTLVTLTTNTAYTDILALSNDIADNGIEGINYYYNVKYSNFGHWSDGSESGLDSDKGILQFDRVMNTLAFQVRSDIEPDKTYSLSGTEEVETDLGPLHGTSLVVSGNNEIIDGQGWAGVTLGNTTQSMDISDVSSFKNFGTVAITNKALGTLTLSNVTFEDNTTADIDNSGTLNLSGTNHFEKIIDTDTSGSLSITSGTTTVGTLEQNILSISFDATLKNNGTSVIGGGTNEGTINGNGTLSNTGTFTNSGTIHQSTVFNSGTFTNGGSGITGNVTNSGGTFTNNAQINGTLTVTGGSFINNANITGTVTNAGTLTTSTANLGSTISNTGTLNLTGTLAQNVLGNGTTNVNSTLTMNNGAAITGTLNLNSGTVTVSNGTITQHNLGALTGTGNLSIDLNAVAGMADSFVVAGDAASAGTAIISAINLLGDETVIANLPDFSIQILHGGNSNIDVTDALKTAYYKSTSENRNEPLETDVEWDDVFHLQERTNTRTLSRAQSVVDGIYDTLKLETVPSEWHNTATVIGDTLDLINSYDVAIDKNFSFGSASNVYTLGEAYALATGLSETKGTLRINGIISGDNRSTINMNNLKGFTLGDNTTLLAIDKVKITGANTTDDGAAINAISTTKTTKAEIANSVMQSNQAATGRGGAIYNALSGDSTIPTVGMAISNSSFISNSAANGGAIYNAGTMDISGTAAFSSNSATTHGGAIYNSGTLTIANGASFTSNSATEGSAIYNLGTLSITNPTFTGNTGNSYIYNGADSELSIIATTNLNLNNGTSAIIDNRNVLNLTGSGTSVMTISDEIKNNISAKGTINSSGKIKINNTVTNQSVNVTSGTLTLGVEDGAVSDILKNTDLIIKNDSTVKVYNKNISSGTITFNSEDDTLSVSDSSDTSISAVLTGSGKLEKLGSGTKLSITGDNDNSGFTGQIRIDGGTVAFNTTNDKFISKNAKINILGGSAFEYTSQDTTLTFQDSSFADVRFLGANGNVTIIGEGAGVSVYTLNSDWITLNANTNNLYFKNSDYILNTTFAKTSGSADNITFDNSSVKLGENIPSTASVIYPDTGAKDYDLGSNNYIFKDSSLDLSNKVAGDNYTFSNLVFNGENNKITLDVNLYLDESISKMPYADTITSDGGSGIVKITKLFVTDDNGKFTSTVPPDKGVIRIFKGDNGLKVAAADDLQILSWATNVYKYGVTSATTEHPQDSIRISPRGISSTDTLRDLNMYNAPTGGLRGFSFIATNGLQENNKYHIYRDLDTTSAGDFSIVGTMTEETPGIKEKSVLDGTLTALIILDRENDGILVDDGGVWKYNGIEINDSANTLHHYDDIPTIEGELPGYIIDVAGLTPEGQTRGSMFELTNATSLEITDVTIQNAMRYSSDTIKDGSVIYANNANATVVLDNVDFVNNEVEGGNGGAVANILSQSFAMMDYLMTGNKASGNGGAFYNTSTGQTVLTNILAYSNTSTGGNGGAIYTSANMRIADSNFGVDKTGAAALNMASGNPNDIYINTGATLTFDTSAKDTSIINSGIAGAGTFNKVGGKTLILSGTNNNFTGTFTAINGTVQYNADDVNDTFVGGSVKVAENSILKMNISAIDGMADQYINNLSGYTDSESITSHGSIIKIGDGNLNIGGNNSDFEGTMTVKAGSLIYQADENSDRYIKGLTIIGDTDNANALANLTLNIGNVTGQTISGITSVATSASEKQTLTKTGAGNITLNGDNSSFWGKTTINAGTLTYSPENITDKYFSGNTLINENGTLKTTVAKTNAEDDELTGQTIGNISGTGSFTVANEYTNAATQGKITLVGANSGFTGTTSIQSGILAYTNNNGTFVGGPVDISANGTLEYNTAVNQSIANVIKGTGKFNKLGAQTLTLTGNLGEFGGVVDIDAGTLAYNTSNNNTFFGTGTTFELANNTNLNITTGEDKSVNLQNVSGTSSSTINKYGVGTIALAGDNSSFAGTLNIDNGKVTFNNNGTNKYIDGSTTIGVNGTLDYTANIISELTKVSGTGNVNKLGAQNLTFNEEDNASFTGTVNSKAGNLVVQGNKTDGFGFSTVINGGNLSYTAKNSAANITIGGTTAPNVSFAGTGNATFSGHGTNVTTYVLGAITGITDSNTVTIDSSTIQFSATNYSAGQYEFNNSHIDMDDNAYSNIYLKNLDLTGTNTIALDVNLGTMPNSPVSDTIQIDNGTGNLSIVLSELNVHNATTNNLDNGLNPTYSFNVITGDSDVVLSSDSATKWSTNVYEYDVTLTGDSKGILLTQNKAATNNSLKNINLYNGTRGFSLTDNDNVPYEIGSSLGTTAAGMITIKGNNKTISGNDSYSMFDVENNTTLKIENATIVYANGTEGSVIKSNNTNAKVQLDNVNFNGNNSSGNGGAISNLLSSQFVIDGSTMYDNHSNGLGGAIYTAADMSIKNSDFGVTAHNTDSNGLNDIYIAGATVTLDYTDSAHTIKSGIAGDGTIAKTGDQDLNLSGKNDNFTGIFDVQAGNVNYTQNSSQDTYVSGETKIAAGSTVTITNNKSDLTTGNFSGAGDLVKDGSKDMNFSGDNSGFTGTFDVQSGNVNFTQNTDSDKYISGNTQIASGSTVTIINDLSDIDAGDFSGAGVIAKAGAKDMNLIGDNLALTGTFDIQSGNVNFTQNDASDKYISGNTKISDGSTLKIINDLSNVDIGNFSGAGNVIKDGANDLNLIGDNSALTGTFDIQNGNVNFTQIDASDKYVGGNTIIGANSTVTLTNDFSDIDAGNFSGSGNLVKDGSENMNLVGDNSNMNGTFTINNGSVNYDADSGATYFSGKTIINTNGLLSVNNNSDTSISTISGDGKVSKNGDGILTLNGNNSEFIGDMDINGGTLAFGAGAVAGNINNAVFANDTVLSLQNTTVVQRADGSFTTNPSPASIETLHFNNLTLNGRVGLKLDVDLKNSVSDKVSADTVSGSGAFIIGENSLNVIADALLANTNIRITEGALATGNRIRLANSEMTVMGPIQKYNVNYSNGMLGFTRRDNPSDFNPAVMASPVATQIGGYLTQTQTLHDGFFHLERYMKYSAKQRRAAEMKNYYAINTISGTEQPELPELSNTMWVKPYTTFERVNLRGGTGVSNVSYGALYGGDSDMHDFGHGFKGIVSTFIGYNGSHQAYQGIDINQQGGALGLTGTLYRGNFFTAITASVGASAGEAYTQYGRDNFAMITAGIANKTGYNFEFKDGKYVIQPSLFLGYTFANTFDYTNAAGVRMDSDPLNAIQIVPGIKFIANLKNGWQPYAGVDMVWSIMDKTNVMANDVRLPQLSVKPYVQYGVGIQKSWGERFTGFFQTMLRNGGRNGVVLQGGFKWAIGKDPKKEKDVVKVKTSVKDPAETKINNTTEKTSQKAVKNKTKTKNNNLTDTKKETQKLTDKKAKVQKPVKNNVKAKPENKKVKMTRKYKKSFWSTWLEKLNGKPDPVKPYPGARTLIKSP